MRSVLSALAFLGRYGTQSFALSLFVGLALPPLAALARPLLGFTIFMFLLATFVRLDLASMVKILRAPGRFLLACACTVIIPPVAVAIGIGLIGRDHLDPGLLLGLAVLAAAPPIMSSPAIAMLLGIEPGLIVATVVTVTVMSPLLSPLIADWIAGAAIPLDVAALILRLLTFVGGAGLVAVVLRRAVSRDSFMRHRTSLDGLGVLMYFVFAVAAMDGVLPALLADPWRVARYLAAAFGLSLAGYGLSWVLLSRIRPSERLVLGYATGQRNMGLLIAALGASAPDTTYLFFALAQFPIYIGPQIISLVRRRFALFDEAAPASTAKSDPP